MYDKRNKITVSNKMKTGWVRGDVMPRPTQSMPEMGTFPAPEGTPIATMPAPPIVTLPAPLPEMPSDCGAGWCNAFAMVTIRPQTWSETYDATQGFERGTIFPELDFPFVGEGACRYE